MKKALFFISLLFITVGAKAQDLETQEQDNHPKFSLGVGTGMNSFTGLLGASANLRIAERIYLQGGLGLSTWGYRSSIGIRYDESVGNGFIFGLAIAGSSGVRDIQLDLETTDGFETNVIMDLNWAGSLNLKTGYNWWIGKNSSFYVDLGYAIPFVKQPWQVKDGNSLNSTSQQVLEIIAPGGFMLGVGFTFGI